MPSSEEQFIHVSFIFVTVEKLLSCGEILILSCRSWREIISCGDIYFGKIHLRKINMVRWEEEAVIHCSSTNWESNIFCKEKALAHPAAPKISTKNVSEKSLKKGEGRKW